MTPTHERVPAARRGARPTVVVVDDDTETREALAEELESHGLRCLTAEDGREALDIMHHGQPQVDAVVLDLMMPVMDGWQVLARMRTDDSLRDIPVLVISAGDPRAFSALPPWQRSMKKPLELDGFLRTVDAMLEEAGSTS